MSQKRFGEGISEEQRQVIPLSAAFNEEKQASYLSDKNLKYYHYAFPALEGMIQRTWQSNGNLLIKTYDPTIVEREKIDENGVKTTEKEARGFVEYSRYSLAFIEANKRQIRKLGLDAKQEIHRLFEKETNLARSIISPLKEIGVVVKDDGSTSVGGVFTDIDNYNKHFYQFFSVVRQLYEGKISIEEVAKHNVSLLFQYILYNFPRVLYLADFYHELNRERILLRQGTDEFKSWLFEFLSVFKIDYAICVAEKEKISHEVKKDNTKYKEKIVTKLGKAVNLLENFDEAERKERGNQLKEIVVELKGVKK